MDRGQNHLFDHLRETLGLPQATFDRVPGGFTPNQHFIVRTDNDRFFAKVIDEAEHPVEAGVLQHEALIYEVLDGLNLTGRIFPEYRGFRDDDGLQVLMLEYLDDVSWGGPWTLENLDLADDALARLHYPSISKPVRSKLSAIRKSLDEVLKDNPGALSRNRRARLFLQAWDYDTCSFRNALGESYFQASSADFIEVVAERATREIGSRLILQDVNFGNIGFGAKQAFLVDPAALRLGTPSHDRTVLGINILAAMEGNLSPDLAEPGANILAPTENEMIKWTARERFITSLPSAARFAIGCVSITALSPEIMRSNWGRAHQTWARIALQECVRLMNHSSTDVT